MSTEPPEGNRRGQWLRGLLDVCVLALLAASGESYGYELTQALEEAGLGQVQGGTLYPVLLRMERAALIEAIWRTSASGPARKYYRLTEAGRRELLATGTSWAAFAARVDNILKEGGIN